MSESKNISVNWSLVILIVFVLLACFAPLLTPYHPLEQPDLVTQKLLPPSWDHWMGTDALSRDVFSRVLYGARNSLWIGALSVFVSISCGTVLGAFAALRGGWIDKVLMRFTDGMLSLPRLVILLAVVGLAPGEKSFFLIILILGFTGWMASARLVRAEVLSLKEKEFVLAARSLGISNFGLFWGHILPNCWSVISVSAALSLGSAILSEAALSYLGLGLAPPEPSWGNLIEEGMSVLQIAPWVVVFPTMAISLLVLAANLAGETKSKIE